MTLTTKGSDIILHTLSKNISQLSKNTDRSIEDIEKLETALQYQDAINSTLTGSPHTIDQLGKQLTDLQAEIWNLQDAAAEGIHKTTVTKCCLQTAEIQKQYENTKNIFDNLTPQIKALKIQTGPSLETKQINQYNRRVTG